MGKLALVVVIGFATIVGIVGTSMNKRTTQAQRNTASLYEKTQARNIAKSATAIYSRELIKNPNLEGAFSLNLMGGRAVVNVDEKVNGNRDNILFNSNGTYGSAGYVIKLDANALPSIPQVTAALMLASGSTARINQNGNTEIDGNNHNDNGTRSSSYPGVAGVSLSNIGLLPNVTLTTNCVGASGIVPNSVVVPNTPALERNIKQWMKYPDILVTSSASNADLGSTSNPKVTYIKALGSNINLGGSGAGILIIETRNRSVSTGGFNYKGLVVVTGSGSASLDLGANSKIAGAVYVSGSSLTVNLNGNAWIRYSRATLDSYSKLAAASVPPLYSFANLR